MTYSYPTGTMQKRKVQGADLYFSINGPFKGNCESLVSAKEFFTFILRAAFQAWMLISSTTIPHGCTFTHIHSRELLSTTTAYDCSFSQAAWGQGHLDGSC